MVLVFTAIMVRLRRRSANQKEKQRMTKNVANVEMVTTIATGSPLSSPTQLEEELSNGVEEEEEVNGINNDDHEVFDNFNKNNNNNNGDVSGGKSVLDHLLSSREAK
jgi:hypothetical protein